MHLCAKDQPDRYRIRLQSTQIEQHVQHNVLLTRASPGTHLPVADQLNVHTSLSRSTRLPAHDRLRGGRSTTTIHWSQPNSRSLRYPGSKCCDQRSATSCTGWSSIDQCTSYRTLSLSYRGKEINPDARVAADTQFIVTFPSIVNRMGSAKSYRGRESPPAGEGPCSARLADPPGSLLRHFPPAFPAMRGFGDFGIRASQK
jgi:hypothetical protein